jgi:shikimate kinase
MTGREFADTDDYIIKAAGKSIPEIFAEEGEEAFRSLEHNMLKDLCKQSGLIIATGGGIVTRQENKNIIRQNGVVIFLDRDIGELPLSGRPISEREGISALAQKRLPLYSKWSDYTIAVRGVKETAADIYEKYNGGMFL